MTPQIEEEVKRANTFGDRIENFIVAKGQAPTGNRNTLLLAYWSLTFELHRAILSLISYGFCGAAFALVRPIIEATARAHVVLMCSEDDLKKIHADEYRTNLATIGKDIDAAFNTDQLFQNFLNGARKALHSFTHAGLLQLVRRFKGNKLIAHYEDGEIIEVIHTSTSAAFMVNNLVTKHFGFEDEWKKNTEMYAEWGKHDRACR